MLYEDDTKEHYFHIFYNPSRMATEREQIEIKIDKYKFFLKKQEGRSIAFSGVYPEYFTIFYDGRDVRFLFAQERQDAIQRELDLAGYFCIVTSEQMTAEEALVIYKGRVPSEKLFSYSLY